MAAACTVTDASEENVAGNTDNLNNDFLDAQIVAQAITELQGVQGPILHIQDGSSIETEEVNDLVANIQTDGETTETHVIYYIDSNGSFTGTLEKSFADSSVQANDYEIERRSGRVPARKRVIPNKFRDYKNTSHDESSDSDFDPNEYKKVPRVSIKKKPVSVSKVDPNEGVIKAASSAVKVRGVGRPRKHFLPSTTAKGASISQEYFSPVPSAEVERKFQEAIRLSEQEAQPEHTDNSTEAPEGPKSADSGGKEDDGQSKQKSEGTEDSPDIIVVEKRGRGRPRGPFWKKSYKCPDCGKSFNQKANLRIHLLIHTEERPYPCAEEGCNKRFRSNEGLRRHLLSHQGIKPFECNVCGNRFSSNVALIEHQSRHTNEKPYQCQFCERKFRQVSCLRRHITTHSDNLPYKCKICQRQFAQPAYLRSHMKVHTGEKSFKCDVCDKRFAHQSDVKRHRTTHTGEKPYSCGKCQAKFSDVSSKNRHEKEHENSKRFTCHLCSDTFKRMGQLRSHLTRRHSHTFAVKIEKDPSNGTFSFKMGEEGDPSSVFVTQKRILSLIKNLQNKGFTEIENIALVSLPEEADISQLEKEMDASEIEREVGVPVELQGVEVQGEDNQHTYITINDFSGSWNQAEKNDSDNGTVHYQKVQIITDDGEKKEILIPCSSVEEDVNVQVAYTNADDHQSDGIITFGAEESMISDVAISGPNSSNIAIATPHTDNVIVEENKIVESSLVDGDKGKLVAYEVSNKDVVNDESHVNVADNNAIQTGAIDGLVIEETSIISLNEITTESNQPGNSIPEPQSVNQQNDTNMIIEGNVINDINETHVEITASDEHTTLDTESVNTEPLNTTVVTESEHDNKTESPVAVDYVSNPDFGCQEYYNWLTKFTELCKVVPMPLDMSLFQKISQVHKTLSDVMANPSGVVADRENFTVLMNITKELSTIINEHLVFVLENLKPETKSFSDSALVR